MSAEGARLFFSRISQAKGQGMLYYDIVLYFSELFNSNFVFL